MAGRLSIGVDVGGTTIKFGVVREDGSILRQDAVPTLAEGAPMPCWDESPME
jgi:predicted NBD/HSP70 family sugar kinase